MRSNIFSRKNTFFDGVTVRENTGFVVSSARSSLFVSISTAAVVVSPAKMQTENFEHKTIKGPFMTNQVVPHLIK